MSARKLLLGLALVVGELAYAGGALPKTVDVVILSRHGPSRVEVQGGCRLSSDKAALDVRSLSAAGDGVRACDGAKRCVTRPQVEVACGSDLTLRAGAIQRRYGKRLKATVRGGALRLVATVPLEPYVAAVVSQELGDAPLEARVAQAVLARTFAVHATKHPRHDDAPLCDLTHCQLFAGMTTKKTALVAARRSRGRVLLDERGAPAPVFYHSTCGGRTIPAERAWPGLKAPLLVGVKDLDGEGQPFCKKSPHATWAVELEDRALAEALSPLAGRPLDASRLRLEPSAPDGATFLVGDDDGEVVVPGTQLHSVLGQALGWSKVKSSSFTVTRAGRWFRLVGTGLGHRVGLCQHGAMARARAGQSAEEILRAYFPRLELAR